ncbi:MAG: hypothetical protein ACRC32_21090 [Chroococcidiopsis sp.]
MPNKRFKNKSGLRSMCAIAPQCKLQFLPEKFRRISRDRVKFYEICVDLRRSDSVEPSPLQ